MINYIIDKIKVKATEDDYRYWLRQEEYIKRKDIKLNDVKFSVLFLYGASCQFVFSFVVFIIFW